MMRKDHTQKIKKFQKTVWEYYRLHKRAMPWRPIRTNDRGRPTSNGVKETLDPYHVLVSEVMLQQTQVSRVIPKYEKFLEKFPNVESLANAPLGQVLKLWSGLGYNRRAINLHKCAKEIAGRFGGKFPKTIPELDSLPGIGEATAGAILAYAFNTPAVYIETNIRRVFLHFFFNPIRTNGASPTSNGINDADCKMVDDKVILPFVEKALDLKNPREWYYALMDYGAMLKATVPNPNRRSKHYAKQSKFAGSNREVRGRILKVLISEKKMKYQNLVKYVLDDRAEKNISAMIEEGFIKKAGNFVTLA